MNLFNYAKDTLIQGDINATQVYGNVYNAPARVTNIATQNNYHGTPLQGIDLLYQYTSPAALLDARARRDPPRCMEGTREVIIQEILDWLKKVTESSSILWLQGPAGHGKTALEFTIAEICKRKGFLIGSFFFSNRITNCGDANLLFATLAAELIQACPSTKFYIDKAIRDDPHIFHKALVTQMKVLIVEPIQRMATLAHIDTVTFGRKSCPTLVVIDGLDECADLDDQDEIIRIIGDLAQQRGLPLRFLIASRPEPNICETFEKLQSRLSKDSCSTVFLTEDALTRRDIQIYLERKFSELRARRSYLRAEWPGLDIIMRLVDKASGQFIYATTIIIYISSPDDRADDRLDVILKMLDTPVGDTPYAPLDQLYQYIVRTVKHRAQVLLILGQVILAEEMSDEEDILGSPSSSTSQRRIEVILNLRVGDVKRLLNRMHSVIDVGEDLKLLHTSFQDFLLDPSRSNDFVVNLPEARVMMGLAYIQAICNCSSKTSTNPEPARKCKPELSNAHKAIQNNLDHSFSPYSKYTGDLGDVSCAIIISSFRDAIQFTRYDHPNLSIYLSNLARSLSRLFEYTGDSTCISSTISVQRSVVQLTPNDHSDMPHRLRNLGNSFLCRFERTGYVGDITEAISAHQRAVELTPNGHADMPSRLSNLGNSFLRRFKRTVDLTDINNAISAHQKAVELTPDGHADMPGQLSNLGTSFLCRFGHTGDLLDTFNAISAHQRAIELTPNGHADMPGQLSNLGDSFWRRFERTGYVGDITKAISAHQRAVELTPSGHADMPSRLSRLGISFLRRFTCTGDLINITNLNAISAHQRAVELTPNGHADIPRRSSNLRNPFLHRFKRTDNLTDITNAISAHQHAIELTPDDFDDMPRRSNNLRNPILRHFKRTGDLTDITNAISAHRRAVELTPNGHADMLGRLGNLGNSILCRFECTGDLTDITSAISVHQRVVELTPNDHADILGRLSTLGTSFLRRFESTDNLTDITEAISAHQRAIELTPNGHADMPSRASDLGISFLRRFERTSYLTDITSAISALQKAVQLTPKNHADVPSRSSNLGTSLLRRFECTGNLTDITNAISAYQRVVILTLHDHPDMPNRLSNLGIAFLRRFERTGDVTDITNAISTHQRAVELTPNGHVDMPSRLKNLGTFLLRRFECTDDLTDITNAISAHQRVIEHTPNGHGDMPSRLSNLGNSFLRRFEHTGDLTDITNAISAHQRAVELTPNGHADMSSQSNNLGNSFLRRFQHTGDLTDITNAISAHQRAVELTPNGHAKMPSRSSDLGTSFLRCFERTGDLTDIANAISAQQRAVELTPSGHADMPSRLSNLGNLFLRRFERTGDFSDTTAAISNYRHSAMHKSGPPSVRLTAARRWAQLSLSHNPTESLRAYDVVVNLLSHIAGMDRSIQRHRSSLVDISMVTTTAASTAFAQGEVGKALEWLEQGRCLVWSQLNQLHTPVEDLKTHDHLLADRLLHVSRALESSGSRQELISPALNRTMSQKVTLEDEARAHTMLAQEWEQLLDEIRGLPAFHNFLQPRPALNIMRHLPQDGPVILINVHDDRCDALALIPDCDQPYHIPLNDLTHAYVSVLHNRLRSYLSSHGCRMREVGDRPAPNPNFDKSDIYKVLQELWSRVAKPILDILAYSAHPAELRRLWWCSTGPLAFLPLHAAGIYGADIQSSRICVSDFVVSSYTPTVNTLLEKVKTSSSGRPSTPKILLVSQPYTPGLPPIPGTMRGIDALCDTFGTGGCEFLRLEGFDATTNRVKQEMEKYGWVHLACNTSQDTRNPLKSAFLLHDGRLELTEIIKQNASSSQCKLAFLSAFQTSAGDEKLSEEASHLAAGMLVAGYQGVVATMWSTKDRYASEVTGSFYEYLVEKGKNEGNPRLENAQAAHALHHATQCLRKQIGDTEDALLAWVPYVHFGL